MTKWQEQLKKRAKNGDQEADDILWETKDMDETELAQYLASNDERVRSVLRMKSLAENGADVDLVREYDQMLTKGQMAWLGEGRRDANANKLRTIDEWMELFAVPKDSEGYTDDQRAAFTNPENDKYFGNRGQDELLRKAISAYGNGASVSRLMDEIQRVAYDWQHRNQVEGYGPNNELFASANNYGLDWFVSALKGFAAPRIKEAQLEGRDVTWQDVTGDMMEMGLSFVPGVGIVSKTGAVVAKMPKVAGIATKGLAYGLDVGAVPLGSQGYDKLVNSGVLPGVEARDVPRAEFDPARAAAQAATVGVGKAAVKGKVRSLKDVAEGSLGGEAGTAEYGGIKNFFEDIGEKTPDAIKKRQAVLDRKAELAAQKENVPNGTPGFVAPSVVKNGGFANPNDITNAQSFRILTEDADRIAKANKAKATFLADQTPENYAAYKQAADLPEGAREFVMLDDGRFVYKQPGMVGEGATGYVPEGANYSLNPPKKVTMLSEPTQGTDLEFNAPQSVQVKPDKYNVDFVPGETEYTQVITGMPREQATMTAISKDPLLQRTLDKNIGRKEIARDVVASVLFNGMSHNDFFGKLSDIEQKRADAWWNRQMRNLGELTRSGSGFSPKERQENFEAIMDVMYYGLDNIPVEKFNKRPDAYHNIAAKLGNSGWKHFSEIPDVAPTTSYSTYMQSSSSAE